MVVNRASNNMQPVICWERQGSLRQSFEPHPLHPLMHVLLSSFGTNNVSFEVVHVVVVGNPALQVRVWPHMDGLSLCRMDEKGGTQREREDNPHRNPFH